MLNAVNALSIHNGRKLPVIFIPSTGNFTNCEYISKAYLSDVDASTGIVTVNLEAKNNLYNHICCKHNYYFIFYVQKQSKNCSCFNYCPFMFTISYRKK